jgi:predicted phosphoribosyltransferase
MFQNRRDAGEQLAKALGEYAASRPVVLALPRGGVPVAAIVAEALHAPLDIIVVRKIGHPSNPEYALGAVDASGGTLLDEGQCAHVDAEWLQAKIDEESREAARRERVYRGGADAVDVSGKTVILVDDGIATGASIRLALRRLRSAHPTRVVVAIPVAPPDAIEAIKAEGADDVVVLENPAEYRGAVGAHYEIFDQVSDEEVRRHMGA